MSKDIVRFIGKVILLSLILLIVLSLTNILYIKFILPQKNIYKVYNQYLDNKDKDLKIIFFGDSHPGRTIDPRYIPNSFNLAYSAETVEQSFYKIRTILEKPFVEVYVLPLDLHTFQNWVSNPYFEIRFWANFMSLKELSRETNHSLLFLYINKDYPVIGKGEELSRLFFNQEQTEIINGWEKKEGDFSLEKNKESIADIRVERQFRDFPQLVDEDLFSSFMATLALLRKHNKTIVLVKYPLTDQYISAIESKGINRTEYHNSIMSRLEFLNYDRLYLLDYQDSFRHNLSLFRDSDHLNPGGARMFSNRIYNDLKNIEKFSLVKVSSKK